MVKSNERTNLHIIFSRDHVVQDILLQWAYLPNKDITEKEIKPRSHGNDEAKCSIEQRMGRTTQNRHNLRVIQRPLHVAVKHENACESMILAFVGKEELYQTDLWRRNIQANDSCGRGTNINMRLLYSSLRRNHCMIMPLVRHGQSLCRSMHRHW